MKGTMTSAPAEVERESSQVVSSSGTRVLDLFLSLKEDPLTLLERCHSGVSVGS